MADIFIHFNNFLELLRIFLQALDAFGYVFLILMVLGMVPAAAFVMHIFRSPVRNVLALGFLVALVFCVYFGLVNENWIFLGISGLVACVLMAAMIYADRRLSDRRAKHKRTPTKMLSAMDDDDREPGRKRNRDG